MMAAIRPWKLYLGISLLALVFVLCAAVYDFFHGGIFADKFPITQLIITTKYQDTFIEQLWKDGWHERVSHELQWEPTIRPSKEGIVYTPFANNAEQTLRGNIINQNPSLTQSFQITPICTQNHVRYYLVDDTALLWVFDGDSRYRWVMCSDFKGLNPDKTPRELRDIAHKLIRTGSWKWFRIFAEYCRKRHDDYAVRTVARYAAGEFTPQELALNNDSHTSKEAMQIFAQELLKRQR